MNIKFASACALLVLLAGNTEYARTAFAQRYENKETGSLYDSVDAKNCHFINLM